MILCVLEVMGREIYPLNIISKREIDKGKLINGINVTENTEMKM